MPTQEDIDKVLNAKRMESEAHGKTKLLLAAAQEKLKVFEGIDPASIGRLQKIEGDATSEKIAAFVDDAVAARLGLATAELQRKLGTQTEQLQKLTAARAELARQITTSKIEQTIRESARLANVLPEAVDDLIALAKVDGATVTDDGRVVLPDGRDATGWLEDRKATSPWAWPVSRGSGAHGDSHDRGGLMDSPDNPWKAETFSLTRQGQILTRTPAVAARLMSAAGVKQ